ncbi:SusC/RagA family TonB-linked outer membrane protein [Parapedobacter deserti]|uniref:SusC/RagA family TonB-linked outer membrane protein n=1 Tax=Parapedobacter deserti TaxID=1912957 RepID=A0ABV7JKX2_9SPHI
MNNYYISILLMVGIWCPLASMAQEPASGRVDDQYGYGLAFVTIHDQAGVSHGQTDENGAFTIALADTATLVFRLAGYEAVRQFVRPGQQGITLVMGPDSRTAIVDLAFGQQAHHAVTAAVATVSSTVLRETPVPTLSNTLFGRLPGLTVMQGSGEPGYDAPQMLIRGKGTYQDNSFLIFVDGLETPFDQLSVDEIETISVLKDAAALSQFGIRGANGALWVTTKRGQAGKTRITLNARNGWQQPIALPRFVDAYDYARLYNEALQNDGLAPRYSSDELEAYRTGEDPYLYPNVNWYDEVLRSYAPQRDASLTFSGGGQTARYFILLGYNRNEGLYANTDRDRVENSNADFQRYNFRANVDMQLSKYVSAAMDLGGRIEDRYFPNFNGPQLWDNMARFPANAYPVRNPNGTWGGNALFFDNPVASVLDRGFNSSTDRNLMATLRLTEHLDFITEGLSLRQTVAFNNWHRGNYNKTRNIAVYELSTQTGEDGQQELIYRQHGTRTDLSIDQGGNDQWNRTNLQFSLNYDRNFGVNGISAQLMYYQDVYAVSGNNVPYANQSVMGRFHYGYADTYFAELGFSYSGSERFPAGNRFGFFPALSGAWLVSNEEFLKGSTAISYLKARASVGLLGNDRLVGPRFAYQQDFYYSGNYYFGPGNNSFGTIVEGVPGNPDISWEKSLQYNLGVEATMYNRLDIGLDAYYENRWDILATDDGTVPSYVGLGSAYRNMGEVNNWGFEATASYRKALGDLTYHVGGSVFYSRNKVVAMNEVVRAEPYLYRTGHPVGQPFGLQADGFWEAADFDGSGSLLPGRPVSTFAPVQPGDIRYVDQNNDGLIDENDYVAIGNAFEPALSYTMNVGGAFKGLDFQVFFQGTGERSLFLGGTYFWALQNDNNIPVMALNRWTPQTAGQANYPRLSTLPNDNNYQNSSFWMRSGAMLRLRNVELGYTFPRGWQQKLRLNNLRLYVSGINLATWSSVQGTDPESIGGYPPLKSYNVGLTAQF